MPRRGHELHPDRTVARCHRIVHELCRPRVRGEPRQPRLRPCRTRPHQRHIAGCREIRGRPGLRLPRWRQRRRWRSRRRPSRQEEVREGIAVHGFGGPAGAAEGILRLAPPRLTGEVREGPSRRHPPHDPPRHDADALRMLGMDTAGTRGRHRRRRGGFPAKVRSGGVLPCPRPREHGAGGRGWHQALPGLQERNLHRRIR
mmetsp:Transcript_1280/g.3212  ORF Transcript_1280/g.3212 Transcript_1280/m.3212 type:complete len:201 (+) Transcript_1280:1926-2528(+)